MKSRSKLLHESGDYGVSPVIGVMLMIIVTIIVAAVVSAFAGGMSTSVKEAPVTSFEFRIYEKYVYASYAGDPTAGIPYIIMTMKNGDTLATKDLKIISTRWDAFGNPRQVVYDPASNATQLKWNTYTGTSSTPRGIHSFSGPNTYKGFGQEDSYWKPGDQYCGYAMLVVGECASSTGVAAASCRNRGPQTGEVVGFEVVHKPTNTVIYQTKVTTI